MKGIGKIIKHMDSEHNILKFLHIQANGRMIYNGDLEKKNGSMEVNIKESIGKEKNMEKAFLCGLMELIMQDNLKMVQLQVMEKWFIIMGKNTKVIFLKGNCTEKDALYGRIKRNILANILKIKNREKANFCGLMEENMRGYGLMDFSMESDSFLIRMGVLEKGCGKMVLESGG